MRCLAALDCSTLASVTGGQSAACADALKAHERNLWRGFGALLGHALAPDAPRRAALGDALEAYERSRRRVVTVCPPDLHPPARRSRR